MRNNLKIGLALLCTTLLCNAHAGESMSTTIAFATTSGNWHYSGTAGSGLFTFSNDVQVIRCLGGTTDKLIDAKVFLPSMTMTKSGNQYLLTPTGDLSITNANGSVTYFKGGIKGGNLVPMGSTAGAYTSFKADIQNYTINNACKSAALTEIASCGDSATLDFSLSFTGRPNFKSMLDLGGTGMDGMAGSISLDRQTAAVPAPGALLLTAIGSVVVGHFRRCRTK